MNESYDKLKELFGEDLTHDLFPELRIADAIAGMTAILQTICNILVQKGVITKEEYLKWFSDEELKKMAKHIEEHANLEIQV